MKQDVIKLSDLSRGYGHALRHAASIGMISDKDVDKIDTWASAKTTEIVVDRALGKTPQDEIDTFDKQDALLVEKVDGVLDKMRALADSIDPSLMERAFKTARKDRHRERYGDSKSDSSENSQWV